MAESKTVKKFIKELNGLELSPPLFNSAILVQSSGWNLKKYFNTYYKDRSSSPVLIMMNDKEGIMYYSWGKVRKLAEESFLSYWNNEAWLKKRTKQYQILSKQIHKLYLKQTHSYGLPLEIRTLLKITDDFNYWQDERKKGTFWATHYLSIFLTEISKRTGYSLEELKYVMPEEMGKVMAKKIKRTELRKRIGYCMIIFVENKYDIITDKKLIRELDLIGTGKGSGDTELQGFSASLGHVTGKVKITRSVEEISKVQKGDVLVAVMTRPDYLPAMQKAAALVTDEGGITCHAAIVAREMKKPCVIGTKIGTQVFKDGDTVEVDANKGVVRKING